MNDADPIALEENAALAAERDGLQIRLRVAEQTLARRNEQKEIAFDSLRIANAANERLRDELASLRASRGENETLAHANELKQQLAAANARCAECAEKVSDLEFLIDHLAFSRALVCQAKNGEFFEIHCEPRGWRAAIRAARVDVTKPTNPPAAHERHDGREERGWKVIKFLKRLTCSHRFDYKDLVGRPTPTGNVTWPCWKCGRVFTAHCGLYVLSDSGGKVEAKPTPNRTAEECI